MLESKTTLIADALHGTIGLSPLEKRLISTRAFNRLHNVLQNSTVYFTFPSNRTSRFSHSLGVAKIAGEMFRSALINADEHTRERFLVDALTQLQALEASADFLSDIKLMISPDSGRKDVTEYALGNLSNQFYTGLLIPDLKKDHQFVYVVLLQSLRIAALLHDLGHPPFSHVTEHALQRIYDNLTASTNSDYEKRLLGSLRGFLEQAGGGAFHEALGVTLSKNLLSDLVQEIRSSDQRDKLIFFALHIKHCTLAILREQHEPFTSIHKIIASDLDADRLDYVQRDVLMSGLSREPFRPSRLIQSFVLFQQNKKAKSYQFVPSVRALNNVEDFFIQRFHLYKYVVHHHRVVKFDALLQESVEALSKRHMAAMKAQLTDATKNSTASAPALKATAKVAEKFDDYLLAGNISGLWQVFPADVMAFSSQSESYYIQWDDAWLLSILRNEYFSLKRSTPQTEEPLLPLRVQLEELLSNRKHYRVLFKRAECFYHIDESFVRACPRKYNWARLAEVLAGGKQAGFLKGRCKELQEYIRQLQKHVNHEHELTRLVESNGYFISKLCQVIKEAKGKRTPIPFIRTAGQEFAKQRKDEVADVLVIRKDIGPGVNRRFLLADTSNRPIQLGRISRVADELERASLLSPPFFVYVLTKGDAPSEERAKRWRNTFGQKLWQAFDSWVKEELKLNAERR